MFGRGFLHSVNSLDDDFVVYPGERNPRLDAQAADREDTVGRLVLDYVYEVYQAIDRIGGFNT